MIRYSLSSQAPLHSHLLYMSDRHSVGLTFNQRLQVVSSPQSDCEAPYVLHFLRAGCILQICHGGLASCYATEV